MSIGKIILPIVIAVSMFACGGGGGGDSNTVTDFPNVAGDYSLTTGTVNYTCSDNSSGSIPASSSGTTISQSLSTLSAPPAGPIPGFTILDDPGLTGNVAMDRSFVMQKSMRVYFIALSTNATVSYNLNGAFTSNGWSGTYTYTVMLDNPLESCTYVTTFTGSRTSTGKTSDQLEKNIFDGNYFYESTIYVEISELGKAL